MDNLEFANLTSVTKVPFNMELLNESLDQSHGQSEMSPADMKLAIVALQGLVNQQERMIQALVKEVHEIKSRKRFFI